MANANKDSKYSRRAFLGALGVVGVAAAQFSEKILPSAAPPADYKQPYPRQQHITPPGSRGHAHFRSHCTGCQLCVNSCPNGALTGATPNGLRLAQPVLSYERGFCRPGCQRCGGVCPSGAIQRLDRGAKSSLKIGQAVVDFKACVVVTDGVSCGQCSRRCPSGAIEMIETEFEGQRRTLPSVDPAHCIGCGACEYYCPARPLSAIHVEGIQLHQEI